MHQVEITHLVLELLLGHSELLNCTLQSRAPVFRHKRFADAKSDAAFIESLIGSDGHSRLVPHTKKKKPSLGAIDRDLTNELVYSPC